MSDFIKIYKKLKSAALNVEKDKVYVENSRQWSNNSGETMEKSFNEDELADIMSEIESLESDIESTEMASEKSEEIIEPQVEEENVHHFEAKKEQEHAPSHSSMNFHVEGQMNLSLGFNIQGKDVQIEVTGEGMKITMDNGATFLLPVDSEKAA